MSTNPFRQTRAQPEVDLLTDQIQRASSQLTQQTSDEGGTAPIGLSVNTKVPSSLDRHVSFASPPVDTTIPAASYPSSPESTRFSPPAQVAQPTAPNYRSVFSYDPFEELRQDGAHDRSIQEAISNTQSNVTLVQEPETQKDTVRETLSRFASAPKPVASQPSTAVPNQTTAGRQSLDVDAFKRLLLTGESSQSTPGAVTPPVSKIGTHVLHDGSSGTDTASISQSSIFDRKPGSIDETSRSSHEVDEEEFEQRSRVPPPAPAPRRGKSLKVNKPTSETQSLPKQPLAPPVTRRQSSRTASAKSEEAIASLSNTISPIELIRPSLPAPPPPPPPTRRQHPPTPRRTSNDLTTTMEEPESGIAVSVSSRRSSNDRPMPPPSRNSSTSIKRQSMGFMNPPPLPPPRKGRGSSRSSMDDFRPPLSSIVQHDPEQGNDYVPSEEQESAVAAVTSNAHDILAELANLQKEVDAARRGA